MENRELYNDKSKMISNFCESPEDLNTRKKIFFDSAKGYKVFSLDRKCYYDLTNGKGSVILGHNDEDVNKEIINFLNSSKNILTGPNEYLLNLSDIILQDVNLYDSKICFYNTGTDACKSAAILAQKYTKKEIILSAGYHGWDTIWENSGKFLEPNRHGVIDFYFIPSLLENLIKKYKDNIAMIIISPDYVYLSKNTINNIIYLAKSNHILFCCDDVKQGYRHNIGTSLKQITDIQADLYTFSKGLANGYKLSCLVGNAEILNSASNLTFTSYFDSLPYIAAITTLNKMKNNNGYEKMKKIGYILVNGMKDIVSNSNVPIEIYGKDVIFQFVLKNKELEKEFYQLSLENDLLLFECDNQTISYCFDYELIDTVLIKFKKVVDTLSNKYKFINDESITKEQVFKTAWNMIDGATDLIEESKAIKIIPELI